jgi:hypothetical protein
VSPKLPQSACAYILSEQLGEEDFEVMGPTRRLVLRLPNSVWHKKATGFAQTFACRCSECVKELNAELNGTGSKLFISLTMKLDDISLYTMTSISLGQKLVYEKLEGLFGGDSGAIGCKTFI